MMETCWSPPGAETVLTPFSISPIPLLSKCFDLVEGAEPGAYPARLARLGVNNLTPDPSEIVTSVPDTSYRAALLERHCHPFVPGQSICIFEIKVYWSITAFAV